MATKLYIYNEALIICGERILSAVDEARKPRYYLDHVYDNGGIEACLEEDEWEFAMRTSRLDYDTSIAPDFGYQRAFAKPSDWRKTGAVCEDEYYNQPLLAYVFEAGYWYCDLDQIYIRYVSDDASYGLDLTAWPQQFADFVAAHFASKIILKLTSDEKKIEKILGIRKMKLKEAKSHNASGSPTKFPAEGSWNGSRRGRRRGDRGNRNALTG